MPVFVYPYINYHGYKEAPSDKCSFPIQDRTQVKVKFSMARSLPEENLPPQNVGSIINYLQ